MPDIEDISAFLHSLTAVSPSHYQIWDAQGKMRFTTAKKASDFQTTASHLKMAKTVIRSNTFSYTPVGKNQYLCGHPIETPPAKRGAVLAMGPIPGGTGGNGHPGQIESLLGYVARLASNGSAGISEISPEIQDPMEHNFEDLYLFANISKQFRSLRFKQPVLGKILHRMTSSLDADAAFLQLDALPQYDVMEIRPESISGNGRCDISMDQLQSMVTAGLAQCKGNYCLVNDSREESVFDALCDRPYRFLATAVRHMRKKYGWVGLVSYQVDRQFKTHDLDIVQTMANQLAVMIANMEQHDDLEKFTVNIVCSLVNAIEAKDAFVRGHSKRVHRYAMLMARGLKLSEKEREALKWAAVLHDIGKIGIPERILCKPGKLNEKEFDLIKQHPEKGRDILSPIRQLAPSLEAIAHHHEKFDGNGYPKGLNGKEIPLAARIIAVADTFDALTSKRSYHETRDPMAALLVLEEVAGTQLDPHLVKVFSKIIRQENGLAQRR